MNIKSCCNDDNYIECAGELKEITVTITLAEYRNLIEERCYSDKAIEQLQEENELLRKESEELKRENSILINHFSAESTEIKKAAKIIVAVMRKAFADTKKERGAENGST